MKYTDASGTDIMERMVHYDAADFNRKDLLRAKGGRKVFVVFSTFGEREAGLIHDKIAVLRKELSDYIDGILVSHRRVGEAEEQTERRAREAWDGVEVLVCNDFAVPDMGDGAGQGRGHAARPVPHQRLLEEGGVRPQRGRRVSRRGRRAPLLRRAFRPGPERGGARRQRFRARELLARPGPRKKFVAQPLFSVIDHPALKRMTDYHYPLSGEVAGTLAFFNAVHFWQRYGVETGINVDTCMNGHRVADVNLGLYDHEHHADIDIQKMAFGIIRTYLMQLRDYGIITLADGASISDTFKECFIDEEGRRQRLEFELSEKKYEPLRNIL